VKRLPAFRFAVGPSPARWLPPVCIVLAVLVVQPAIGEGTQQTEPRRIPVTGACHVSPIVDNLDKSARFYHNLLGLDLVPSPPAGPLPWDTDPGHLHMHGTDGARIRFIGARMPGVRCGVELVEFGNIERRPVHRRLQDPGTVTLILLVRDIDAPFERLKKAGVPIVTTGGAPVAMSASNKTRAVIVKDPDGHFVELAELDPQPATTLPAESNVIGIRLRVTVHDLDRSVAYYRRLLGIDGQIRPLTRDKNVAAMLGLPDAQYRLSVAQIPGSTLVLEFLEFTGLEGVPVRSRVQDPGSYRLQLNVRDIDATLAGLSLAGGKVISTKGQPARMTFGGRPWRLAVVDVNNLFLVVQQGPPPAAP
jgi:catechol 2,3-dioxygenase-like lactoylglutathione lyase family enzyme/predicted enzyme related to lactoylglutathione lyase